MMYTCWEVDICHLYVECLLQRYTPCNVIIANYITKVIKVLDSGTAGSRLTIGSLRKFPELLNSGIHFLL